MAVFNLDARTLLRCMTDESVDMIFTDPPYRVISGGRPVSARSPSGMLTLNDGKVFKHNDIDIAEYAAELFRVLKSPGHAYIMTNTINLWRFRDVLVSVGFDVHALLVWQKQNVVVNRWFMKNGEFALFLRKGPARTIYTHGARMVHDFNNPVGRKSHPTEKPVDLVRYYIEASSLPGEIVFDPFMGTGAAGVAAAQTGRRFIGCEIDPEFYRKALTRIGTEC